MTLLKKSLTISTGLDTDHLLPDRLILRSCILMKQIVMRVNCLLGYLNDLSRSS